MKLTKEIREKIIRKIIVDSTAKEEESLKKRENKLAVVCYNTVYSKQERDAASALPAGWLRTCNCLRFNIAGMTVQLRAAEHMRTKYNDHCYTLGTITDDGIRQQFMAYHNDVESLKTKKRQIEAQATAVLGAVNTYKQLQETWPEGKKFYSEFAPKKESQNLPAVLIEDFNKTLGIKSK